MKDALLHSGLKKSKRKLVHKAPIKTGRISSTVWISPKGKVMDRSLSQVSGGIVYRDGDYAVEKWYYGKVDFYDILKNNKAIAYNRDSLTESKQDINRFKKHEDNLDAYINDWHPEASKLLNSKTDNRGSDIDIPIRPLIKELNNAGYKTAWSCAGHKDDDESKDGFVTFDKSQSDENCVKIVKILKSYGIEDIKYGDDNKNRTVFRFKRVE